MKTKKIILISAIAGFFSAIPFIFENLYFLIFLSISPTIYCMIKNQNKIFLSVFSHMFSFYFFCDIWFFAIGTNFLSSKILGILLSFLLIFLVSSILSLVVSLPFLLLKTFNTSNPLIIALAISFTYIFGEWLQGIFPINFPWNRLCNIVSCNSNLIKSSSFFGGLFISFIIILINVLVAYIIIYFKENKKSVMYAVISIYSIFLINNVLGITADKIYSTENKDPREILIVQANHTTKEKNNLEPNQLLDSYLKLSEENITDKTKLIVFPETAISSSFYYNSSYREKLLDFVEKKNISILFGLSYRRDDKRYNSAAILYPDKTMSEIYSKQQLVPFGEYTPFFLPESMHFLENAFTKGTQSIILESDIGNIGCCICFESVFPNLSRKNTLLNAEILAVLTNDAWLGKYIPIYQHHSHSVLRAVENRKYMITSANTGISSVISPEGKIITKTQKNNTQTITANVYTNNIKTFYSKVGDVIIIPSILILMFLLVRQFAFWVKYFINKLKKA